MAACFLSLAEWFFALWWGFVFSVFLLMLLGRVWGFLGRFSVVFSVGFVLFLGFLGGGVDGGCLCFLIIFCMFVFLFVLCFLWFVFLFVCLFFICLGFGGFFVVFFFIPRISKAVSINFLICVKVHIYRIPRCVGKCSDFPERLRQTTRLISNNQL